MPATLQHEQSALVVNLTEWDWAGPSDNAGLRSTSLMGDAAARRIADALRSKVDIREGYEGLEISTTSFVGRVDVGPLRIVIKPKLPAMPLTRLLRYAYGLRDLTIKEETQTPTARDGLQDLLIAMLAAEVDELLHRGLARFYVPLEDRLESPRGKILIQELVSRGGLTEAKLPCRHFERRADWHLNQVLRAGVIEAAKFCDDREVRRHLHRSVDMFGDVTALAVLEAKELDRAERGLSRQTSSYASALTIIRLLLEMRGVAFGSDNKPSSTPGFLFDMNVFFQRLLSRFLHENLATRRIEDEFVIREIFTFAHDANPKRRTPPKPRPDYGLFDGKKLIGFLDAKYRDSWTRGFPAEWLYQASIYALASPSHVSVLLYATMSEAACDEKINIQQPITWSNNSPGSVILRPVPLIQLAELLDPKRIRAQTIQRQQWAEDLVRLTVRKIKISQLGISQSAA